MKTLENGALSMPWMKIEFPFPNSNPIIQHISHVLNIIANPNRESITPVLASTTQAATSSNYTRSYKLWCDRSLSKLRQKRHPDHTSLSCFRKHWQKLFFHMMPAIILSPDLLTTWPFKKWTLSKINYLYTLIWKTRDYAIIAEWTSPKSFLKKMKQ